MAALPTAAVADVLALLAEYLPVCPHLEFILKWLQALCLKHGPAIQVSILGLQTTIHYQELQMMGSLQRCFMCDQDDVAM